jgi:hypothetical protein
VIVNIGDPEPQGGGWGDWLSWPVDVLRALGDKVRDVLGRVLGITLEGLDSLLLAVLAIGVGVLLWRSIT